MNDTQNASDPVTSPTRAERISLTFGFHRRKSVEGHRPGEPSFVYQPFAGLEDDFRFNDETFERVIRDYNLNDLAI